MVIVPVPGKPRPDVELPRINVVAVATLVVCCAAGFVTAAKTENPLYAIGGVLLGLLLMLSPKVAKQWEKGVVLRLGRFVGLRGPGLFFVVPLLDTVSQWIDQRVIT